jgi:hypothetical protein
MMKAWMLILAGAALLVLITLALANAADHQVVCQEPVPAITGLAPKCLADHPCTYSDETSGPVAWGSGGDPWCPARDGVLCMLHFKDAQQGFVSVPWPVCTIDGTHQPLPSMGIGHGELGGYGWQSPPEWRVSTLSKRQNMSSGAFAQQGEPTVPAATCLLHRPMQQQRAYPAPPDPALYCTSHVTIMCRACPTVATPQEEARVMTNGFLVHSLVGDQGCHECLAPAGCEHDVRHPASWGADPSIAPLPTLPRYQFRNELTQHLVSVPMPPAPFAPWCEISDHTLHFIVVDGQAVPDPARHDPQQAEAQLRFDIQKALRIQDEQRRAGHP